jgi:hypothetical protein
MNFSLLSLTSQTPVWSVKPVWRGVPRSIGLFGLWVRKLCDLGLVRDSCVPAFVGLVMASPVWAGVG